MGTFLGWDPKARTVTAVPNLSVIRRKYENCDDAIRVAYESGAYSYQQIAKEFEVHFTMVGRIVRQPKKGGESNPPEKVANGPSCAMIIDLTP